MYSECPHCQEKTILWFRKGVPTGGRYGGRTSPVGCRDCGAYSVVRPGYRGRLETTTFLVMAASAMLWFFARIEPWIILGLPVWRAWMWHKAPLTPLSAEQAADLEHAPRGFLFTIGLLAFFAALWAKAPVALIISGVMVIVGAVLLAHELPRRP